MARYVTVCRLPVNSNNSCSDSTQKNAQCAITFHFTYNETLIFGGISTRVCTSLRLHNILKILAMSCFSSPNTMFLYIRKEHFPRACLKNAFCKIYVTICGRFCLNEGGVAGYVNRTKTKSPAKWGM